MIHACSGDARGAARAVPAQALRAVAYADEDLLLPGGASDRAAGARADDPGGADQRERGRAVARLHDRLRGGDRGPAGGDRDPGPARPATAHRRDPARDLGVDNVVVAVSDQPTGGQPSQAPFDVILLAGAVDVVPPALCEQVGEGGRVVAVIDDGRVGKGTCSPAPRGDRPYARCAMRRRRPAPGSGPARGCVLDRGPGRSRCGSTSGPVAARRDLRGRKQPGARA